MKNILFSIAFIAACALHAEAQQTDSSWTRGIYTTQDTIAALLKKYPTFSYYKTNDGRYVVLYSLLKDGRWGRIVDTNRFQKVYMSTFTTLDPLKK